MDVLCAGAAMAEIAPGEAGLPPKPRGKRTNVQASNIFYLKPEYIE
jgi:hypothetical protein